MARRELCVDTRQDRTITDCLAVLDLILPLKLRHIGFKDVGVDKKTLAALAERIRKSGATTYMEVVSTSPAEALNSAKVAVELGIDRLLGDERVQRSKPTAEQMATLDRLRAVLNERLAGGPQRAPVGKTRLPRAKA